MGASAERDQRPFQWVRATGGTGPDEGPGAGRGERQLQCQRNAPRGVVAEPGVPTTSLRPHTPGRRWPWNARSSVKRPTTVPVTAEWLMPIPRDSASTTRASQPADATRPRGPPSGWRSPRACRAAPTQGPPRPHRPGSDHPCRACRRRTPPGAGRFRPTCRAT